MFDVRSETLKAIHDEEVNLVSHHVRDSLMDVFRANYDLWVSELFPLLRILRKNNYEYLSSILGRSGYEVSASQVGLYLNKVKNEKNKRRCS